MNKVRERKSHKRRETQRAPVSLGLRFCLVQRMWHMHTNYGCHSKRRQTGKHVTWISPLHQFGNAVKWMAGHTSHTTEQQCACRKSPLFWKPEEAGGKKPNIDLWKVFASLGTHLLIIPYKRPWWLSDFLFFLFSFFPIILHILLKMWKVNKKCIGSFTSDSYLQHTALYK